MKKMDLANGCDMDAVFAPMVAGGNKIIRRGQFDIQIQTILKNGNCLKNTLPLRIDFDVNIDGLIPETQQQGGGPPGKINTALALGPRRKLAHKSLEPFVG